MNLFTYESVAVESCRRLGVDPYEPVIHPEINYMVPRWQMVAQEMHSLVININLLRQAGIIQ